MGDTMDNLHYGSMTWNLDDAKNYIDEFMNLYEHRPIQNNKGGMLSSHLFWAWYVMKKRQPKFIIESGVFKGQGTWAFRQACPQASIFSIDPRLDKRVYIDDEVKYFDVDFNEIDWAKLVNPLQTVIFFDDHQNAYTRLQQMNWMGFKEAMFEDNYPVGTGDVYSLNKVMSIELYDELRNTSDLSADDNIKKSMAHKKYCKDNLEEYTVFPPLYLAEKTRWGNEWNSAGFEVDVPLLDEKVLKRYPVILEEAHNYTWIAYARLK